MRRFFISAAFSILVCAGCAFAQNKPLDGGSTVDDVLDGLQACGQSTRTFSADLKVDEIDMTFGTDLFRFGNVQYQIVPDGDAAFHVLLDRKTVGSKTVPDKIEYQLEKGWLTVRTFKTKNENRIQLAAPGQKVNLFQLGKGPFPLPIGQDKEDVHAGFDVTKSAPANDDPSNTVHLILTPKSGTKLADSFSQVEIWVDLKTAMPVRIATVDGRQTVKKVFDFLNLQVNQPIAPAALQVSPLPGDWTTSNKPMTQ